MNKGERIFSFENEDFKFKLKLKNKEIDDSNFITLFDLILGYLSNSEQQIKNPLTEGFLLNRTSPLVKTEVKEQERDNFNIRKRIPNTIDMSQFKLEMGKNENVLIRCTDCGQAIGAVIINQFDCYFVRYVKERNSFELIDTFKYSAQALEQISIKQSDPEFLDKLEYETSLNALPVKEELDIIITEDTNIYCPICKITEPARDWLKCHKHPQDYFPYVNPCRVCAGEQVSIYDDKQKINFLVCEDCGHKEEEIIDAERRN